MLRCCRIATVLYCIYICFATVPTSVPSPGIGYAVFPGHPPPTMCVSSFPHTHACCAQRHHHNRSTHLPHRCARYESCPPVFCLTPASRLSVSLTPACECMWYVYVMLAISRTFNPFSLGTITRIHVTHSVQMYYIHKRSNSSSVSSSSPCTLCTLPNIIPLADVVVVVEHSCVLYTCAHNALSGKSSRSCRRRRDRGKTGRTGACSKCDSLKICGHNASKLPTSYSLVNIWL